MSEDQAEAVLPPVTEDSGAYAATDATDATDADAATKAALDLLFGDDSDDEFKGFPTARPHVATEDVFDDAGEDDAPHKKKSKQKRKSDDSEDSDDDGGDDDDEDGEALDNEQGGKKSAKRQRREKKEGGGKGAKKGRKKKLTEEDLQRIDTHSAELVANMQAAYNQDLESYRARKPALHKLKLLDDVVAAMLKPLWRAYLVKSGLLTQLSNWLRCLDPLTSTESAAVKSAKTAALVDMDAEEPPPAPKAAAIPLHQKLLATQKIRDRLLPIIEDMHVMDVEGAKEKLKEAGLGRVLMELIKHPKESQINKTVAQRIVTDWERALLHKSTSYNPDSQDANADRGIQRVTKQVDFAKLNKPIPLPVDLPKPGEEGYRTHPSFPRLVVRELKARPAQMQMREKTSNFSSLKKQMFPKK